MPQARPVRPLLLVVGLVMVLCTPATSPRAVAAGATTGSCAGFTNRIGMTDKVIRIGNAVDNTGPVPGLYRSARQATRAYVAYFNSRHRICGRKLVVDLHDSKTDASADKAAYAKICTQDFAAVGSMSVFDDGGASTAQGCRLPDVRSASSTNVRNACATCFGVRATRAGEGPNAVPDYFVQTHAGASQHAAMLYLNAGPYPRHALDLEKVAQARGMHFVYSSAIDVTDFNYAPYVAQLKSNGAQWVQLVGGYQQSVRLARAMQTANFHPDVFLVDPSAYTADFASSGGDAVEGAITTIDSLALTSNQTELKLYRAWLAKVVPGAAPTIPGLYAWSAAKLFTQKARALGARLTRANLNASLRTVTAWTGGGLHAPMAVGTKHVSGCVRFLVLHHGHWVSMAGTSYHCAGTTKVS